MRSHSPTIFGIQFGHTRHQCWPADPTAWSLFLMAVSCLQIVMHSMRSRVCCKRIHEVVKHGSVHSSYEHFVPTMRYICSCSSLQLFFVPVTCYYCHSLCRIFMENTYSLLATCPILTKSTGSAKSSYLSNSCIVLGGYLLDNWILQKIGCVTPPPWIAGINQRGVGFQYYTCIRREYVTTKLSMEQGETGGVQNKFNQPGRTR